MRWNIASASFEKLVGALRLENRYLPRVSILKPRARNFGILLVNCETEIGEVFLKLVCHQQSGSSSTNANNVDMSFSMNWTSETTLFLLVGRCIRGNLDV